MFGMIMPLCNRIFCGFFGWYFYIEIRLKYEKIFCCPALELFHCLPLWKTVLFVSSRAFLLSTPTFLLSTPVENSEATWKKATKCNKCRFQYYIGLLSKPLKKPELNQTGKQNIRSFLYYLIMSCICYDRNRWTI